MDHDVVSSVIDALFPPGSALTTSPNDVPPSARFYVIPGQDGPRWIIPHEPQPALSYLRHSAPYRRSSRLKWAGILAAYRLECLNVLEGIRSIGVDVSAGNGWAHLGWGEGSDPVPVVYVGTPGPTRKAVAALISAESGRLISIAKAPLTDAAANAIRREAATLRLLSAERPGLAPRLLWADTGRGVTMQEAVAGVRPTPRLTTNHVDWLASLTLPGESVCLRSVAEAFHCHMPPSAGDEAGSRSLLSRALAACDDPNPLPAVWMHGDFAPWNLKCDARQPLRAVDWEWAERGGLPLFDLIYHEAQLSYLLGQPTRMTVAVKWFRRYLDRLQIAQTLLPRIVTACLSLDAWRWWREGQTARATFSLTEAAPWAESCR